MTRCEQCSKTKFGADINPCTVSPNKEKSFGRSRQSRGDDASKINIANNKSLLLKMEMHLTTNRNQNMNHSNQYNYPKTVCDNAWEDLSIMYESWKTVHGVDRQFCIDMIRKFANYLEHEKY